MWFEQRVNNGLVILMKKLKTWNKINIELLQGTILNHWILEVRHFQLVFFYNVFLIGDLTDKSTQFQLHSTKVELKSYCTFFSIMKFVDHFGWSRFYMFNYRSMWLIQFPWSTKLILVTHPLLGTHFENQNEENWPLYTVSFWFISSVISLPTSFLNKS